MLRSLLLGFFNRCHEKRIAMPTRESCAFARDLLRITGGKERMRL
jgi:hypothetical protein